MQDARLGPTLEQRLPTEEENAGVAAVVEAAVDEHRRRKKGVYVGAPACFALELVCQHLNKAFDGRCYLVGSALQRPDWRDIDVRFMMADEDFQALFPDVHNLQGTWEFDPRWLDHDDLGLDDKADWSARRFPVPASRLGE